jgi:hypothetical protein
VNEFADVTVNARGLLFRFSDGLRNWLPARVSPNEAARLRFFDFVMVYVTRA